MCNFQGVESGFIKLESPGKLAKWVHLHKHPPCQIQVTDVKNSPFISRNHWRLLRLELRWAYRDRVEQKHVRHWNFSPHTSAWLVLKGWARVEKKEGAAEACKGNWLIAPPGERMQQASEDCELLSIAFLARWVFGRELFPMSYPITFSEREVPALRTLGLRLASDAERLFPHARHELPEHSGPTNAHLRLTAGFYAWFEVLGSALEKRGIKPDFLELDPRVEEAVQILDRAEQRMPNPAEVARRIGLSPSQMNRLFRQELGITVHDYCQRRKRVAARTLLAAPGSTVKETAFQLGFLSSQHFSRWFRLGTGMTPSECQASGNKTL